MVEPITLKAKPTDNGQFGDADTWKAIFSTVSPKQDWIERTEAMEIDGVGVMVRVSSFRNNQVAEALSFVPFVKIVDILDTDGKLIGRRIDMRSVEDYPNE